MRKKSLLFLARSGADAEGERQTTLSFSSSGIMARASSLVAPPITILTPRF